MKHLLLTLVLIGICAPPVVAERGRPAWFERDGKDFRERKEEFREKMIKELKLTKEQQAALKKFREKRKEVREIGLDIRDKKDELVLLLKDESSSEQDIRKKADQLNDMMLKMNKSRLENMLELRSVLDGKQFKKFMRFIEKMRDRFQSGAHSSGRGGPPPHGRSPHGPGHGRGGGPLG